MRAAVDLGSVNLPVESAHNSNVEYESQRSRFDIGVSTEDEKSTKTPPPVDVGEILRRWTHALQAVHKQTLRLVRIAYALIWCFLFFLKRNRGRVNLTFLLYAVYPILMKI